MASPSSVTANRPITMKDNEGTSHAVYNVAIDSSASASARFTKYNLYQINYNSSGQMIMARLRGDYDMSSSIYMKVTSGSYDLASSTTMSAAYSGTSSLTLSFTRSNDGQSRAPCSLTKSISYGTDLYGSGSYYFLYIYYIASGKVWNAVLEKGDTLIYIKRDLQKYMTLNLRNDTLYPYSSSASSGNGQEVKNLVIKENGNLANSLKATWTANESPVYAMNLLDSDPKDSWAGEYNPIMETVEWLYKPSLMFWCGSATSPAIQATVASNVGFRFIPYPASDLIVDEWWGNYSKGTSEGSSSTTVYNYAYDQDNNPDMTVLPGSKRYHSSISSNYLAYRANVSVSDTSLQTYCENMIKNFSSLYDINNRITGIDNIQPYTVAYYINSDKTTLIEVKCSGYIYNSSTNKIYVYRNTPYPCGALWETIYPVLSATSSNKASVISTSRSEGGTFYKHKKRCQYNVPTAYMGWYKGGTSSYPGVINLELKGDKGSVGTYTISDVGQYYFSYEIINGYWLYKFYPDNYGFYDEVADCYGIYSAYIHNTKAAAYAHAADYSS